MRNGNARAEEKLEAVRRRLQQWRRGRRGNAGRIPHEFWELAAEAAEACGAEQAADRLQLDPERLQEWIDHREGPREGSEPASFVELAPFPFGGAAECTLELEEPSGRKLRISLQGQATAQALELSRALWRTLP